jgi:glucose-1-phosphate cytidylyltransferase
MILAGGLGTRIAEATHLRPKPMVEIAGQSIHWHIPELFAHHAMNEFVICGGYEGYVIKEFFANYALQCSVAKRSSGGGCRNPLLRRVPHLRR